MGYENIANYDLSFGEWGNRSDVPVEQGNRD
jgi:3-mercaptopyruvate sulfurtransferase SseA